ncbi:helix-turn-helix domain-containing protein [Streptomyces sp. NPDC059409]|uniref:helix-turn-helix domain-containing protein n=1 Tax=Streptomyces sp. NPDC059409 TaxID=3346824 RepID=UPI0036C21E25
MAPLADEVDDDLGAGPTGQLRHALDLVSGGTPTGARGRAGVADAVYARTGKGDTRCVTDRFARRHRPGAVRALTAYESPKHVRRLRTVVRAAAPRAGVVDARHLPTEVFTGARHRLSRPWELERDDIARCLTEPGTTVAQAARRLGMSRATLHRKTARYGIGVPGRAHPS